MQNIPLGVHCLCFYENTKNYKSNYSFPESPTTTPVMTTTEGREPRIHQSMSSLKQYTRAAKKSLHCQVLKQIVVFNYSYQERLLKCQRSFSSDRISTSPFLPDTQYTLKYALDIKPYWKRLCKIGAILFFIKNYQSSSTKCNTARKIHSTYILKIQFL